LERKWKKAKRGEKKVTHIQYKKGEVLQVWKENEFRGSFYFIWP
jgi:hypothetical protein